MFVFDWIMLYNEKTEYSQTAQEGKQLYISYSSLNKASKLCDITCRYHNQANDKTSTYQ